MSYRKSSRAFLFLLVLAVAIAIAGFRSNGAGRSVQNKSGKPPGRETAQAASEARTSTAAKTATGAGFIGAGPSAFEQAASQNLQLESSLAWSFGGKTQHGWSMYVPLITNLIGADADGPASEFAMKLAMWQKENGIESRGVLESGTWSRMISIFQSRRTGGRDSSGANGLITIPASDCYDPSRPEELRKADAETFYAYKRMLAAAALDPSLGNELSSNREYLKIVSAFRSREYQDQLRRQSPDSGRAGLAIDSPHSTGRALDLYVGGDPVSTKDDNRTLQTRGPVYLWLVKNAARFGFQPYFYEPWHWEYVGIGREPETRRQGDAAK